MRRAGLSPDLGAGIGGVGTARPFDVALAIRAPKWLDHHVKRSVVIPTLNEAAFLGATVKAIRDHAVEGGADEIRVADCRSTDGTRAIAVLLGATVVDVGPGAIGRGAALDAGARGATGDVLFFVDADTVVPAGWDRAIREALEDSRVVAGAFEFALDGRGVALRVVEAINRARYRVWPRYYGDQGVFVRAEAFRRVRGFGARPILESSDLCVRLRRIGKLALVRQPMLTSPRRFVEGGTWRVLAHDARLWWRDLVGAPTDPFAAEYWRANARRGRSGP